MTEYILASIAFLAVGNFFLSAALIKAHGRISKLKGQVESISILLKTLPKGLWKRNDEEDGDEL